MPFLPKISTFKFNDTEIEVYNYLSAEDKYELVMLTLQKAREGKMNIQAGGGGVYGKIEKTKKALNMQVKAPKRKPIEQGNTSSLQDFFKTDGIKRIPGNAINRKKYIHSFITNNTPTARFY